MRELKLHLEYYFGVILDLFPIVLLTGYGLFLLFQLAFPGFVKRCRDMEL